MYYFVVFFWCLYKAGFHFKNLTPTPNRAGQKYTFFFKTHLHVHYGLRNGGTSAHHFFQNFKIILGVPHAPKRPLFHFRLRSARKHTWDDVCKTVSALADNTEANELHNLQISLSTGKNSKEKKNKIRNRK